jgi:hypothetical protein
MAAMQPPSTPAQRADLEGFIARRFERAYGATLAHFLPHLLGLRDASGQWQAAVGYAGAADGPLFLEQYLDAPIERVLERRLGRPVARERVVEVGNLAAARAGIARVLIPSLAARLRSHGFEIAVFTATRELRNAFERLALGPLALAPADPARLRGGAAAWGSYYAHAPTVMGGRISDCLLVLA